MIPFTEFNMKKNLDVILKNLDGTNLKVTDSEGNPTDQDVTVKLVATNVLLHAVRPNENRELEKMVHRYHLSLSLHKGSEQEIKTEDLVLIKQLTPIMYGPLVVGQIHDWAEDVKE